MINASTDGMDLPKAVGIVVILGGIALYMRHLQEGAARHAGAKPATAPSSPMPTIVEAAVPLPPPMEGETPTDVLKPGGQNVGERGTSGTIRILPGGASNAQGLFDRLTKGKGGADITPAAHPGKVISLPDGSTIGIRPKSKSGPPTIDVNVPGLPVRELKFPGGQP